MFQRVTNDEFYLQFRALCKEYAKGFPCENLAFCVKQFQEILLSNRKGIDDSMVMEIFQILFEEFCAECVRRIEEIGKYCCR